MTSPFDGTVADDVPAHPISVVAQRTGLSQDVLRVWERRYGAVEPVRTPGGRRLYSNQHVHRFKLLASATKRGRSIGLIASLTTAALERLVAEDELARHTPDADADAEGARAAAAQSQWSPDRHGAVEAVARTALVHTLALDGASLDRILRRAIAQLGLTVFLEEVVPGFMKTIGEEWIADRLNIAHEHLAAAAVLAILFETRLSVPETPNAPRLLVATPSGESHGVGAALAASAAALDGWSIVYLGVDVPADTIVAAAAASGARAVALSVVHPADSALAVRELHAVRALLPSRVTLIAGGATAVSMVAELSEPGIVVCGSIGEMRSVLARETVVS